MDQLSQSKTTRGKRMKVKMIKNDDEHSIVIPEEVIEMLGWKEETTLKIEVGRDFELNATTIVITKKG